MIKHLFKAVKTISSFDVLMRPLKKSFTPLKYYFSMVSPEHTFKKIVSGISLTEIDTLLSQLSSLSQQHKQKALSLILKGVDSQTIPSSIFLNTDLMTLVDTFPTIFIDYKIIENGLLLNELAQRKNQGMSEKQIPQIFNKICDSFQKCQEKLHQIKQPTQKTNYEVFLKRQYSDFFVTHLRKYFKGDPSNELNKCIEAYRQHNEHIIGAVRNLVNRLNITSQQQQIELKKQILSFLETLTDNILSIIQSTNEIYGLTQNEQLLFEQINKIQQNISSVLSFYSQLGGIDFISVGYINLRKNAAFLNHLLLAHAGQLKESKKQLSEDYNILNNQYLALLTQRSCTMPAKKIWDIALAMVSIKAEELDMINISDDLLKEEITKFISQILLKIRNHKHQNVIKENLHKTLQFILQYRQKNH